MWFPMAGLLAAANLISTVLAIPYVSTRSTEGKFNCTEPVKGLNQTDCEYMVQIGMAGQGENSHAPNDLIWIGKQGPNLFKFVNKSGKGMILIFWHYPIGDYAKLFMSAYAPEVSYSLSPGQKVILSVAHGVSGGWAGIYDSKTILDPLTGLLQNTWGEFTTDPMYLDDAKTVLNDQGRTHVDVSRLVYMKGDKMSIRMDKKKGGCISDFTRCFFECVSAPLTCGRQNEYRLVNCAAGSQPGANYGLLWGQPEGGCAGTTRNGFATVAM